MTTSRSTSRIPFILFRGYSAWIGILTMLFVPALCIGQPPNSEEITFYTADQVEIAGTYYAGSRGKSSPCVMFLHNIGADRHQSGWSELALLLQRKGYAILSFDFRGHGQSTSITPEFWAASLHKSLKPLASTASNTLRLEQFTRPIHLATLVNDIRAAKRVLDIKSREGQCDATSVFVVGAEAGASLGILWVDAEWQRWRIAKDSSGRPTKQGQEALDIAGAAWLSMSPKWIGRYVPIENWLGSPLRERTPMAFVYGADDVKGKERSISVFEKLTNSSKESLNKFSTKFSVSGTALSGNELLANERLAVCDSMANYFATIMDNRRRIIRSSPDLDALPPLLNADAYGLR